MRVSTGALGGERGSEGAGDRPSSGPPHSTAALAAALAAAAEAAVLFLPVRSLSGEIAGAHAGPLAQYPLFVLAFAGSVAALVAVGASARALSMLSGAAIAVGAAQATVWGAGGAVAVVGAMVLTLLIALRVAMLSVRDWRDPMRESFALGAVVLLAELVFGWGDQRWHGTLLLAVPQFFLAALASRAVSLQLAVRPVAARLPGAGGRGRASIAVVAGLAILLALSVAVGGRGGPLEAVGGVVFGLVGHVVAVFAYVFARLVFEPLAWVFSAANLDVPLQEIGQRLREFARTQPRLSSEGGTGAGGRLIGLAVLVLLAVLLVRTIRRFWRFAEQEEEGEEEEVVSVRPLIPSPGLLARSRRRLRRELPSDTVRRWYAEGLLALERMGLPRGPSATPGEYLREVGRTFPACGGPFAALTRAYEDVRYGTLQLGGRRLERLEAEREYFLRMLAEEQPVVKQPAGKAKEGS